MDAYGYQTQIELIGGFWPAVSQCEDCARRGNGECAVVLAMCEFADEIGEFGVGVVDPTGGEIVGVDEEHSSQRLGTI